MNTKSFLVTIERSVLLGHLMKCKTKLIKGSMEALRESPCVRPFGLFPTDPPDIKDARDASALYEAGSLRESSNDASWVKKRNGVRK